MQKEKEEAEWIESQRQARVAARLKKIEDERKAKEAEEAARREEEAAAEQKRREEEAAKEAKKKKKKKGCSGVDGTAEYDC